MRKNQAVSFDETNYAAFIACVYITAKVLWSFAENL